MFNPLPTDTRKAFYAIASDGLAAAQISTAEINGWVKLSNTDPEGWNAALKAIQNAMGIS